MPNTSASLRSERRSKKADEFFLNQVSEDINDRSCCADSR